MISSQRIPFPFHGHNNSIPNQLGITQVFVNHAQAHHAISTDHQTISQIFRHLFISSTFID